ncbi:hypothetical protein EW146_g5979 [Bondarzewia mesenterica]|uniref:Uncharacterized protein n=1 Tax=Bondarzewia mesenterica TaxID=1095465 RepID=A0A4S4LQX6_9AGAM|nr:hypothetical protein EW146_g5979 [Bondarzewia mesenterica]
MPPRSINVDDSLIETIAQERFRYETIFQEQADALRLDAPRFQAAMARLEQSPLLAPRASEDSVDEYLKFCDNICRQEPKDFDDRVRILQASHAALMCIVNFQFIPQSERVQLAIIERHNELRETVWEHAATPVRDIREPPLSKPAGRPRSLTPEELHSFRNPEILHGKQFVISPDTDEKEMYEVSSYTRSRDKKIRYEVLFDDCGDPIPVDEEEMWSMLKDSQYFELEA